MKKNIVFALAALSLVATVHGVNVDWTSGDLSFNATAPIKSVTGYYYVLSSGTAGENAAQALFESGEWGSSDLINTSSTGWSLKDTFAGASLLTPQPTDDSAPWNVNYTQNNVSADEYVIAVYEATTEFGGKYAIATIGYFDYDDTNVLEPGIGAGSVTSGLGSDAISYNKDGGWAAVPEPTTVALLALGLAAVGLKRKVA